MKLFSQLFFLCISAPLFAQMTPAIPGHASVINFTAQDYNASTQNWSIAQLPGSGSIAFANSAGMLFYNGSRWNLQPMPGNPIIRSVAAAPDGKVYAGAFGKAGYWDFSKGIGTAKYESLDSLLFKRGNIKEEIWKIIPTQEFILFQTFNNIYLLFPNRVVQQIKAPDHFIFAQKVNNRLFIPVPGKGLYELRNRQLTPILTPTELAGLRIRCMLPYKDKSMLLADEKMGVWVLSQSGVLNRLGGNGGNWLATHSISFGLQLKNGFYLFGSSDGGAIVISDQGELMDHFDNTTGLQSNTILEGMEDRDGNLWLVGDKGIDLVVLNSPFRLFTTSTKFMDATVWKNNIYFATNHGLFFQNYAEWKNGGSTHFSEVSGIKEFVWNTSVFDNQLIVGSASGTFLIAEDGTARRISSVSGAWILRRLKSDSNYLIQGNYSGLALFKKNARGEWDFFKQIERDIHPVKEIAQDRDGNIYFKHAYEGLFRCRLSGSMDIEQVEVPENLSLFGITPKNSLFEFNGGVYITSDNGILKWQSKEKNIKEAPEIEKALGRNRKTKKIIAGGRGDYWVLPRNENNRFDYLIKTDSGKINRWYSFSIHNFNLNYDYEKIKMLDERDYLLFGGNVLALFSLQNSFNENYLYYKPYFSELLFRDRDKWIEQKMGSDSTITVPNRFNYFMLRYTFPVFDRKVAYRYKLEGNGVQDDWSDWVAAGEREFLNMSPGTYRFTVQTDLVPTTISITIVVLPPWYWSLWAKIVYMLLFGLALYLLLRWYSVRLKTRHELAMQKMSDTLKKQQEALEREQERLKQEQLEMNLNAKVREAADSAMTLIKKNEFLQRIKRDLAKIKGSNDNVVATNQSDRLIRMIDDNIKDDDDERLLFESNFNQVHEQFYKRMLENYPTLTASDLKFAAYLKMNLTSKEIAPLLNITVKSLELKRHRLRKKMNLSSDQNLTEELMKF
jgi:hypothetical protein